MDLNSGREEEFLTLVFSAFHRSGAQFENDMDPYRVEDTNGL